MDLMIRRAALEDKAEWFRMRQGVWPGAPAEYLDFDMDDILSSESDAVLMAFRDGQALGMIEAKLREYGEGWYPSPGGTRPTRDLAHACRVPWARGGRSMHG